jgi:hypothetical protein
MAEGKGKRRWPEAKSGLVESTVAASDALGCGLEILLGQKRHAWCVFPCSHKDLLELIASKRWLHWHSVAPYECTLSNARSVYTGGNMKQEMLPEVQSMLLGPMFVAEKMWWALTLSDEVPTS